MKSDVLSEFWSGASDAERVALLRKVLNTEMTWSAEQLGTEVPEFDRYAKQAGLAPVWVTVVDAAGMRDREEGAACPQHMSRHYRRSFQT